MPNSSRREIAMEPAEMAMLEWQDGYFGGGIGQWSPDRSLDPFSVVSPGAEECTSCSSTFGGGRSFSNNLPTSLSSGLFPHPAVLESPLTVGGCGVGFVEAEEGPVDMGKFGCPAAAAEHHFAEGSRGSSRKRKADGRGRRPEARDCMDTMMQDGGLSDALMSPKSESPAISSCTKGRIAGADRKGKPTAGKERSSEITSKPMHPKASGPAAKADYIHVRARRGQATDSHSLAERARREKISKRMKLLQDLVPGCSKVTGKASVLEEIINYVQSLQRQVEFLSMKLAASASPIFDDDMEAFLDKEIMQMIQLPRGGGVVPPSTAGMLLPPALLDSSFLVHANDIVQSLQATAMRAAVGCGSQEDAVHVGSSCPDEHAAALLRGSTCGTPDLATKCCAQLEPYKVRAMAPTCPWKDDLHGFYDADELRREQLGVGVIPSSSAGAGDVSGFQMTAGIPSPVKLLPGVSYLVGSCPEEKLARE